MNRREFINKSAALVALSGIAGHHAFAASPAKLNKGRIGIQLYSIRNDLPKDFMGSLKKLSDIGYSLVEPYGFQGDKFLGHTMKELSAIVKDMGMAIPSSHIGSKISPDDANDKVSDFWKKVADQLKSGGAKWAVQAGLPEAKTLDDLKKIAAYFNRVGEVCKKNGVKFAFHNHQGEFRKVDGEVILDFLINNTDPKLVSFQLDLGHTVNGGGDCVRYLRDFSGRIALWHASDFDSAKKEYVDVGSGSVPYPALFELADSSGLQQLIVEQETLNDIFGSCKTDFNYLKQFKWTKV